MLCSSAGAQFNTWTNTSSGYWEEPFWSFGVLPASGQYVAITNEGWKAVAIGPTTAQSYPQNLTLQSLTISSPPNSYNVLLMNYAGLETPLTTRFLTVASNSAMTMLYSSLHLNGGTGDGMSIGGEFTQKEWSVVSGQQVDVGYIGPGVYNLNSGVLTLKQMWIGGAFHGEFNQYGGTNRIGLLHLEMGGSYNFYGGDEFPTNIYFLGGDFFHRSGIRYQPTQDGTYVQTGGTNYGSILFGSYGEGGSYTLSNGVSFVPQLMIGARGNYVQWGGAQSVTEPIDITSTYAGPRGGTFKGSLTLNGGVFAGRGISLNGDYIQNGGTNSLSNGITINSPYGRFQLNGGVLMENSVTVNSSYYGYELNQCGGLHIITNELTINGSFSPYGLHGASICEGARMIVADISIHDGGVLNIADGTVIHTGFLRCGTGTILPGPGAHQFGRLQLGTASIATETNSTVSLPLNTNCVVRFRDSSAVPWGNAATLTIRNWSGSVFGGGSQQVIFGADRSALTRQQLSRIFFHDPQGLAPGLYTAVILANGEVVPDALPPTGRVPPTVRLASQADQSVRVTVLGQSGSNYGIDTSSNLLDWTFWTNCVVTNGLMSVVDGKGTTNSARRFYRAVLLP